MAGPAEARIGGGVISLVPIRSARGTIRAGSKALALLEYEEQQRPAGQGPADEAATHRSCTRTRQAGYFIPTRGTRRCFTAGDCVGLGAVCSRNPRLLVNSGGSGSVGMAIEVVLGGWAYRAWHAGQVPQKPPIARRGQSNGDNRAARALSNPPLPSAGSIAGRGGERIVWTAPAHTSKHAYPRTTPRTTHARTHARRQTGS
ncbi:hypothetical protein DFH27DRAFT_523875 [Peziza echinospora]|nr:hypothetical protein DFH27DRAFT_523875 [Peziza echinospora]